LNQIAAIEGRIDKETAGALAISNSAGGMQFETMIQVMEFAKMMAVAGVAVPQHLRGNPGACLAVAIQAVEWRLSPFAVANKSYSVNDRLAYESQLIQAVILQRAPIKGRFKVEYIGAAEKRQCKVSAETNDGETVDYLSPEIGKIKVKNSPLWTGDPDQQLFYFSGRALCRRHFPDVLLGVYASDELEGAERIKDVTPKASGLAARLSGTPVGGFDATGIADALADRVAGAATSDEDQSAASAVAQNGKAEPEPDLIEAAQQGARAFHAGDERKAPEDISPEECAAWFKAFDREKVSAEAAQ
jgi:hypothetical protein